MSTYQGMSDSLTFALSLCIDPLVKSTSTSLQFYLVPANDSLHFQFESNKLIYLSKSYFTEEQDKNGNNLKNEFP